MKKTTWFKTTLALAIGALSGQALAAGFALNEQSISSMGTSFAGRSSSADDATTLFGNPAGMSRLKREEVSFGMAAIHAKTDIKNTSGLPGNGSNDGDMVPFTAVPMGYYVKPIDDKWALGVGVYVPFGMITDYEGGFEGRYFGDYSEVRVITVQPTVSYRFNEQLSVGFGPTINRIDGELQSATLNQATPGLNDGRVKVKGDDTALGFNLGVLYEFTPHTRMGVTYRSKVEYNLEGDTRITGVGFGPFSGHQVRCIAGCNHSRIGGYLADSRAERRLDTLCWRDVDSLEPLRSHRDRERRNVGSTSKQPAHHHRGTGLA